MTLYRAFLWLWLTGLLLFAVVLALHVPLMLTSVPGGIVDHQAAATAMEVDRIQSAWQAAGLLDHATGAIIADLVFIGFYGAGSVLGGLHFARSARASLRMLGSTIAVAGLAFLITDYAETIAQLMQLSAVQGDDRLASLAATVQPVKIAAWIVTLLGLLLALSIDYRRARNA